MYAYNSVIILNGSLPKKKIVSKLVKNKTIISADVPVDALKQKGIIPNIIVGDLDSIDLNTVAPNIEIVKVSDQYTTDFEKAIHFVRKRKLTPTLVLGINGGQLDHVIGNIHIMIKHFKDSKELFFISADHNDYLQLGVVINKYWKKKCPIGTIISIFPFSKATVSTTGLKYQLNKELIEQTNGVLSIRNETLHNEIELTIHKGRVLCIMDIMIDF